MHPLIKVLLIIIALNLVQLGYLVWLTHRHHTALLHGSLKHYGSLAPLAALALIAIFLLVALALNLTVF